jgi:copper transport protein
MYPIRRLMVVLGVLLLAGAPAPALAHTDVDFTLPTDGASVGEVVAEITVAFNEAVTLIGPGFEVLDPQGRVLTPFVVTDDDVVFRLQMDPPLGGGLVAVKYTVAAQDGHTIDGNFTFTVAADAPVVTEPPTTTVPPPTTLPLPADAPTSDPPPSSTAAPATASPATAAPTTAADSLPAATVEPDEAGAGEPAGEASAVDADGGDGSTTTFVLLGLGAAVAAAFVLLLVRSRSGP